MSLWAKIPRDKQLHLMGGAMFAAGASAVLLIGKYVGPGIAISAACLVMGWGVERYQAIRREGTPSKWDWAATSAPGVVAGALLELGLRLQ